MNEDIYKTHAKNEEKKNNLSLNNRNEESKNKIEEKY